LKKTDKQENPQPEQYFDAFLCYHQPDQEAVKFIAKKLTEAGFKLWLDQKNIIPGEPWQERIEEALNNCTTCIVFWGSDGLGPWQNEEIRTVLERRVYEQDFRVIPVLLPECLEADKMPPFLKRLYQVDFRKGLDGPEAFRQLLAGIRGEPPGQE
jgi:hypothetical protein